MSDSSARGAGGGRNLWLLLEKSTARDLRSLGEPRREDLRDHAAHRRTDDVGLRDVEVIEQGRGVIGHVFQRVRRRAG